MQYSAVPQRAMRPDWVSASPRRELEERLYGAHAGGPSWGEWNASTGGQGYWLLSAAAILVIIGIVMLSLKKKL